MVKCNKIFLLLLIYFFSCQGLANPISLSSDKDEKCLSAELNMIRKELRHRIDTISKKNSQLDKKITQLWPNCKSCTLNDIKKNQRVAWEKIINSTESRPSMRHGDSIKIETPRWSEPLLREPTYLQLSEQNDLWMIKKIKSDYQIKRINKSQWNNSNPIISLSQIQTEISQYRALIEWLRLQRIIWSRNQINLLSKESKAPPLRSIVQIYLGESLDLKELVNTTHRELTMLLQTLNQICTSTSDKS